MRYVLYLLSLTIGLLSWQVVWPKSVQAVSGEFAPNELIVQFEKGLTPKDLAYETAKRDAKGKASIVGPVRLLFEDIGYLIRGLELPEKKFVRMQTAGKSVGAISIIPFRSDDVSFERTYILKLDGSIDVLVAGEYYSHLPEVEFVEPNYIYSDIGI